MEKFFRGNDSADTLFGSNGDDVIIDFAGNDWIDSRWGTDRAFGGAGNDQVYGEEGSDYLSGDNGRDKPRVPGEDNDYLSGGAGDDVLFVGDGRDWLKGGEGGDMFVFQFHNPVRGSHNPMPGVFPKQGPEPDVSTILDFDPAQDTFAFDAKGLYNDGFGANFINHASVQPGYPVDTFYSGNASGANGEHVVAITDRSFADGSAAANAISGESAGDIVVYHNSKTHTADLAYVTSANHVDVFAHLSRVDSVSDLANLHLTASDFIFV
ncbi:MULTISPECIES: calcium-binding protein [Sinorhizobium]|uniref:Hemolysin expression modulating protein n=1 Tax=Sinorhizobium americanum TaxID=194963 RepID=A0A2S3YQ64_9HYPH|nr:MULTISPECIES: calcium-binding protein [Sinorhizobium]PDT33980.1 hemolysin expression modulating protein [Sinorhizobium sp. FG01]POH33136.1 hemolysin expression modulating protein [Sinorhizobium americanum]